MAGNNSTPRLSKIKKNQYKDSCLASLRLFVVDKCQMISDFVKPSTTVPLNWYEKDGNETPP